MHFSLHSSFVVIINSQLGFDRTVFVVLRIVAFILFIVYYGVSYTSISSQYRLSVNVITRSWQYWIIDCFVFIPSLVSFRILRFVLSVSLTFFSRFSFLSIFCVWTRIFLLLGRYVTGMLFTCLHIASSIRICFLLSVFLFSLFILLHVLYMHSSWISLTRESNKEGTSNIGAVTRSSYSIITRRLSFNFISFRSILFWYYTSS